MIPWKRIVKLPSLRELMLSDTTELEPQSLPQMPNLDILYISSCDMQSIPNLPRNIKFFEVWWCGSLVDCPSNMSELKSLTRFVLVKCPKLEVRQLLMKLTGLTNLTHLEMCHCNMSHVPDEIGYLVSLKELDLSHNTFSSLPDSLSNLSQLSQLNVMGCSELRSLPLLSSNLTYIRANECGLLDVMPFDSTQGRYIFRSEACRGSRLGKRLRIDFNFPKILNWCMGGITTCLDAYKIGVVSFVAPMHFDKKICGIIIYAQEDTGTRKIHNKTKQTSHCLGEFGAPEYYSTSHVMFYPLDDTTLVLEAGDTMELEFDQERVPRTCGIRLIYDSDVVDYKLLLQNVDGIQDLGVGEGENDDDYDVDDHGW